MIKVLHLISGGDTGGAKTHIFTLMKGLSGRVDTKIICFIKDTFYAEAREEGIDIEVYPQEKRSDLSVVSKCHINRRIANVVIYIKHYL